ncbi:MAG TPA: sulfatase [Anaerolineae bacterium]|nr:sulfatase [Anaerolineae bacterium]
MKQPNIVFVFADQWRAQATGYAGNPTVQTPNLDRLAQESVNFTHAAAGCPVCSPYRASLLTGQYPLTHGVFVNDVYLQPNPHSLAHTFAGNGYATAYIGKWHVDGHGRSSYIPPERRQGFDYWKALECTHSYNQSAYYAGDSDEKLTWEGYDAIAQTRDAQRYIRDHAREEPFLLVLSWGPPHAPYGTAPEEYRALYDPADIALRANVPQEEVARAMEEQAERWARRAAQDPRFKDVPRSRFQSTIEGDLAGYYAHCTALDACVGDLRDTIRACGIEEDTIFCFTSDHGDMLGSHGQFKKQQPWEESIRVPFLLRYPALLGRGGQEVGALIDAPDIMPTLLGLCGLAIPDTVEGLDYSGYLQGGDEPSDGAVLLMCPQPFGQWSRTSSSDAPRHGGREYRGLRTRCYTYTRTLDGPWLLFDNEEDPYQMENLVDRPAYAALVRDLDAWLQRRLDALGDEFLPGLEYIRRWGYPVDETGTVPYTW